MKVRVELSSQNLVSELWTRWMQKWEGKEAARRSSKNLDIGPRSTSCNTFNRSVDSQMMLGRGEPARTRTVEGTASVIKLDGKVRHGCSVKHDAFTGRRSGLRSLSEAMYNRRRVFTTQQLRRQCRDATNKCKRLHTILRRTSITYRRPEVVPSFRRPRLHRRLCKSCEK